MSSTDENGSATVPTAGRRISSNTLLSAFQRLTTRSQPALDASLATSPSVAVTQNGTATYHTIPNMETRHDASAGTISELSASPVPAPAKVTPIVGGPPVLGELISKLEADKPIQTRMAAAKELITILYRYPIKDVLPIWVAGGDLIRLSDEASHTGLLLLASCVKVADPSPMIRRVFWESLISYEGDKFLEIRLQTISDLSSNGNYIEGLEDGISKYLCRLLRSAFKEATNARKKSQRHEGKADTLEEMTLQRAFHLIDQLLKSSSPFLVESDFSLIMDQLISICKKTTSTVDIKNATDVMGTLACYAQISPQYYRPCLNILCNIYKQLDQLTSHIWSVFRVIFNSPMRTDITDMLLHILQAPSGKQMPVEVQGALAVLRDMAKNNGQNNIPTMSLSILGPALNVAMRNNDDVGFALDALEFYKTVVATPFLWTSLYEDADWTNLRETVEKSAAMLILSIPSDISLTGADLGKDAQNGVDALNTITNGICKDFTNLHVLQQEEAVKLFFKLGTLLNDDAVTTLLTYLGTKPHLSSPANADHREIWTQLFQNFANNHSRPPAIRYQTLEHLTEMYEGVQYLPVNEVVDFVQFFLQNLRLDENVEVLEAIAHFFCKALSGLHRDLLFDSIMEKVKSTVFSQYPTDSASPRSPHPNTATPFTDIDTPSPCRIIVRHVIRLFLNLLNESAKHAEYLYHFILDVAAGDVCESDARICALKLLCRIRCTGDYRIYIAPVSESETIAAVLCRTEETAKRTVQPDEIPEKELRITSTGSIVSRPKSGVLRRPVPPLWFYPGPKALPQEPPKTPSLVVYAVNPDPTPSNSSVAVLKLTLWLEIVISLLQQQSLDWEIYSYVLVHLGAQLKNTSLFTSAILHIRMLRNILCDQILSANFHEPPGHTSLRKADVAVCVYHNLTMLIAYNPHFAKSEDDDLVKCLMIGIGSWDGTSKWCIHALSICCHELPLSVSKSLDGILMRLAQIITQPQIAVHILEFLCGLARLPEVFKNFREDQYKLVFGVSFRYLQYVRDQRQRPDSVPSTTTRPSNKRHSDSVRELKPPDLEIRSRPRPEELPQYVYSLAFHVITFWFMALKLRDRPQLMPWIAKNLTYTDSLGNEIIEDQGLVTMDMMDRIAYSDRDETMYEESFAKESDGEILSKTWLVGMSLLTVETAGRTGLSQLTRRRPSGTRYTIYKPSLTLPPRHQVPLTHGLDADAFYSSAYTGVLPEDVLQDLYSSMSLAALPATPMEMPVPLPPDPAIDRTLRFFDFNSTVDGHKIGVVYIAEGQTDEASILANTSGSPAYAEFVSQLGTLVRLKGATMNTQGLDRSDDMDGKYAICWRDRATEVVFHTTTMMPTNLEHDALCINKKKHIGNSFVNVIWNDSGQEFKFDTFPSAFNYVYIVITPESRSDFVAQRLSSTAAQHAEQNGDGAYYPPPRTNPSTNPNTTTTSPIFPSLTGGMPASVSNLNLAGDTPPYANLGHPPQQAAIPRLTYKLQVLSAPGFPVISAANETKMVTAKSLAPLVRMLGLNASFFSLVWSNKSSTGVTGVDEIDLVVSPWRNRLMEIRKLREKYAAGILGNRDGGRTASPAHGNGNDGNRGSGAFLGGAGARASSGQRVSLGFGIGGGE